MKRIFYLIGFLMILLLIGCNNTKEKELQLKINDLSIQLDESKKELKQAKDDLDQGLRNNRLRKDNLVNTLIFETKNALTSSGDAAFLSGMYAEILSSHLHMGSFIKKDTVNENNPVFQDIKKLWNHAYRKANGEKQYFLNLTFLNPVDFSLNTNNGVQKLKTSELWFLLQDKIPSMFFRNEDGTFDQYVLDPRDIWNYDWKIWIKEPLDYSEKIFESTGR